MNSNFETSKDVGWLKELYFSDPARQLVVRKGEILLHEGRHNDRLYIILEGILTGSLKDENGENSEVFRSHANMFVGVYSFFSPERISYLTVTADTDTRVAFIQLADNSGLTPQLAAHFLPVIVHEIYLRQTLAQKLTWQRQAAIRKLYEREKMATLGQLAAGVAHELNNAVSVLVKNSEWLMDAIPAYFRDHDLAGLFNHTVREGQLANTAEIREKRRRLESRFAVTSVLAKQLARTSLSEEQIAGLLKNPDRVNLTLGVIEAGIVLHDMRIAASQAAHVVRSVRELGNSNSNNRSSITIYETVRNAVALTRNMLRNISLVIERENEGTITANPGDLVQIWLNLIRNAAESLLNATTSDPAITIHISTPDDRVHRITITDNGPGIPEEILPKIFQPNFTTKITGLSFGLGVGLSLVKRIINDYKGNISVTSKPGETTFIVTLPRN